MASKTTVAFRLDSDTLASLEEFQEDRELSKSDAARKLLRQGLEYDRMQDEVDRLQQRIDGLEDHIEQMRADHQRLVEEIESDEPSLWSRITSR